MELNKEKYTLDQFLKEAHGFKDGDIVHASVIDFGKPNYDQWVESKMLEESNKKYFYMGTLKEDWFLAGDVLITEEHHEEIKNSAEGPQQMFFYKNTNELVENSNREKVVEFKDGQRFIKLYSEFTESFDYTPPFRVGRKQKRAVLDSKGVQVCLFETGSEKVALDFCEFLNNKYGS